MSDHDVYGYDGDDDDEDIPWADPAIRKDYEAALGRLILAHNDLDLRLTELIGRCLARLGDPPDLKRLTQGQFFQRLENLALLKALPIELQLGWLDVDELRELNRLRNVVAHGHFEQNPYMGDYELISNKSRHKDFSTKRLNEITTKLEDRASHFSAVVAFYDPPAIAGQDAA